MLFSAGSFFYASRLWCCENSNAIWRDFLFLGLSSHSRIFHSYGDVTITGEGLQILTHARHSWPLSSEDSLACHTYCDTGHPFIMVISENPSCSHLLPTFGIKSVNIYMYFPCTFEKLLNYYIKYNIITVECKRKFTAT